MPHKRALDILRDESDKQLDPVAVHAFIEYYLDRWTSAAWAAVVSPQTSLARTVRDGLVGSFVAVVMSTTALAATDFGQGTKPTRDRRKHCDYQHIHVGYAQHVCAVVKRSLNNILGTAAYVTGTERSNSTT